MSSDGARLNDLMRAGFTLDELRDIGEAIGFAATVVGGMEQSASVEFGKDWTPEKRAAWDKFVREMRGGEHGPPP